ncbi:MAG TPA: hypothetical protein VG734_10570 [Lacunisphaera sp.]|nr:hypothetical protein [Lacunisphaera sp.]
MMQFTQAAEAMHEPAARVRKAFAMEPHCLLAVNLGETFHVPLRKSA